MKIVDKIFLNSSFLILGSIITILLSFIYWSIIGKYLPPHDYGIISTTISLSSFLAVLGIFGFNITIVKLLPEYLEKKQNKKVSSLLNFALKSMLVSSILIGLALVIFSSILSNLINLPRLAILISGAFVVFMSAESFIDSTLRGFQNMKWIPVIDVVGNVLKITVSIILIFLGFGYIGPLFGFISLYLATIIIGIKLIPLPRNSENIDEKQVIFKYSLPEFLTRIVYYIFYSGRTIILNIIAGSALTGIFSLAIILTTPIFMFPGVLLQTIFPLVSQLLARKNSKPILTRIIKHYIRYTLLATLPLSIFLIIFSDQIILLFSNMAYLGTSQLIPIIVVASIVFSFGNIFHRTLYVLGETALYRNIMTLSVLIFLIFAITLTYKISVIGMSYAFLIFSLCFSIFSFLKVRKFIEISLPVLSTSKIVISSGITTIILYSLTSLTNGFIFNVIGSILFAVLYLILLLFLRFFEADDIKLLKAAIDRTPFLKRYSKVLLVLLYKYQRRP